MPMHDHLNLLESFGHLIRLIDILLVKQMHRCLNIGNFRRRWHRWPLANGSTPVSVEYPSLISIRGSLAYSGIHLALWGTTCPAIISSWPCCKGIQKSEISVQTFVRVKYFIRMYSDICLCRICYKCHTLYRTMPRRQEQMSFFCHPLSFKFNLWEYEFNSKARHNLFIS